MINTLCITGKSGALYHFHMYELPCSVSYTKGAIYLFIKFLHHHFHVPILLGETDDVSLLLDVYEDLCSTQHDPTHMCLCFEHDEAVRQFAKKDLSEVAETHLMVQAQ